MTPVRYTYGKEIDDETKKLMREGSQNLRFPLREVSVESQAISPNATDWLHCVGAYRKKNRAYIRVISQNRGVNIVVPILPDNSDIILAKLADLRFLVRNCDCIQITFPKITIRSGRQGELYLLAYDFKLKESPC